MKKKLTVGISAFNEQANIGNLLKDLLAQNQTNFTLEAIIIADDCSIDKTISEIKKVKSTKIKVAENKNRKGKAFRLNQIKRLIKSDVFVVLDADTSIKDSLFLSKLAAPIILNKADLTSTRVQELPANNLVEGVLVTSMKIKKSIFESYKKGNNIYTCHGRARAFSKKLYTAIEFEVGFGEDAYSYLFCITKSFKYTYVNSTEIFYRLPNNFRDHQKQSVRFLKSQIILSKKSGKKFVLNQYKLPISLTISALATETLQKPTQVLIYLLTHLYMKLAFLFIKVDTLWDLSESTKRKTFLLFFINHEV